ncbi:MAG: hypothetical protein K8L97_10965 [Anaerolineae bacterium]|nr:hypothetical protein [Anaerolineae bacterium]
MPDNLARLLATVSIWAAALGIMIAMAVTGQEINFIIVAIVMGTSAGATATIWGNTHNDRSAERESEKSKRRSRVERMLESMDDRELEELRARLDENVDGEMVTLDEILAERRRR